MIDDQKVKMIQSKKRKTIRRIKYANLPKEERFAIRLKYGGLKPIYYQIDETASRFNKIIMSSQNVAKFKFNADELRAYKAQNLLPMPLYITEEDALVGEWYLSEETF